MRRRNFALNCLIGAASACLTTWVQWLFWRWLSPLVFILFYPAIIITSLFAGLTAGISSTCVSIVSVIYFFILPSFNFHSTRLSLLIQISVFSLSGLATSILNTRLRKRQTELSDQKQVAKILRSNEERFRILVNSSPNALILTDTQGKIVLVNSTTQKIFGYTQEELIGHPVEILVPERFRATHPAHFKEYMRTPIQRALGAGRDLYGQKKDGSEVPIEIALTPMQMDQGEFILATIVNIAERKQMETALAQSFENTKNALNARDEFISIASHELKTPLTSLKIHAQILQRAFLNSDPKVFTPEKLETIIHKDLHQLERLERLINDLLDVSRINAGHISIEKKRFDLVTLVSEVVEQYDPHCRQEGCRITYQRPDPIFGFWDYHRIEQVVSNLLSNAIKYGQGAPITVSTQTLQSTVEIRVQDAGSGIPQEDQERIFQRFERGIKTAQITGLGLGLFIVRKIVELHGGTIHVESSPGQGSFFIVKLPVGDQK